MSEEIKHQNKPDQDPTFAEMIEALDPSLLDMQIGNGMPASEFLQITTEIKDIAAVIGWKPAELLSFLNEWLLKPRGFYRFVQNKFPEGTIFTYSAEEKKENVGKIPKHLIIEALETEWELRRNFLQKIGFDDTTLRSFETMEVTNILSKLREELLVERDDGRRLKIIEALKYFSEREWLWR